ncbi:DUF397 domain-containing protein [Streptomyces purpurogeneiscleroticus]|uniref:DUF397 domain-containing protein n=1 Tax=Streptomyces purpurogeneiscleroticus TaxID=68259 RepID=UPI001CBCAE94|nr:DUF397 domain-containing protein [Streptomyces purpurogeneiscleroticus]MBZ4014205.1 DUF397 domain-containing protein [Streptomyces purpurogeneiscleroticus]
MAEVPHWRTSSYTKSDTCVEVADNDPSKVMVRDTKDRDAGTLAFPPASWANFVEFSKTASV